MTTAYPAAIDAFTRPSGSDTLATGPHSAIHDNEMDAIEALEAKVGVSSSAVTTAHDYLIAQGQGQWGPAQYGLKSWAFDPFLIGTNTTPTAGTLYGWRMWLPAGTMTNLHVITAGSTTPSTAYWALYTNAGALVVQSPNRSAAFGAAGLRTLALTSGQVVTAGVYVVAYWFTGSAPALMLPTASTGNGYAYPSNPNRVFTADTGLTTTAPATLGTQTQSTIIWAGVS